MDITPDRVTATPPRFRVINGTLYRRATSPYAFDGRIHDLGNGLFEATVLPRYQWDEVDALTPQAQADYLEQLALPPDLTEQEKLDRVAQNRDKSTRRARTHVRRLCKVKALTTMLTLTTRENITDRGTFVRHLDAFFKRVRRLFPSFEYVCVLERQKRGAWHAHIAVRKFAAYLPHKGTLVKSYNLFRALWHGVLGGTDKGNVHAHHGNKRLRGSISKLAGYLSKYIGKHFDGNDRHANSYSASGRALPGPMLERYMTADHFDALGQLLARLRNITGGEAMEVHEVYLDAGGYFVAMEPMRL